LQPTPRRGASCASCWGCHKQGKSGQTWARWDCNRDQVQGACIT
jgi:hypothetical protein